MIRGGVEFDEDTLTGRKRLTIDQLKYLALKYVRDWKAVRRKCEEEIDFQQSIIDVADKHHDVICKDPSSLRQFESHKRRALREIEKYEELLERLKVFQTDVLRTAQWARRQLEELETK